MPIVMTAEIPASTDMYDSINKEMGLSGDNLPKGLIAHYAAPTDNGMLIVDVCPVLEDRWPRYNGPVCAAWSTDTTVGGEFVCSHAYGKYTLRHHQARLPMTVPVDHNTP